MGERWIPAARNEMSLPRVSGAAPTDGPPAAAPLSLVAKDIAFDKTALTAPANTPFQIQFDNQDASIPHDVAIHEGSQSGAEVFKGDVITGPAQKTYDVPPLKAGSYAFFCTIHPNMAGTLTVQ